MRLLLHPRLPKYSSETPRLRLVSFIMIRHTLHNPEGFRSKLKFGTKTVTHVIVFFPPEHCESKVTYECVVRSQRLRAVPARNFRGKNVFPQTT